MMSWDVTLLVEILRRKRRVIPRALRLANGNAVPHMCSLQCWVVVVGPSQVIRLRLAYAGRV
jgi:hypothetical protein